MDETALHLKPGREKSVLNHHPWIFASAIDKVDGIINAGAPITVFDCKRQPVAVAAFSPSSQIRARVWSTNAQEIIDREFLYKRIHASLQRRQNIFDSISNTALRLVYAEADGLPGLVVDRYNNTLVVQILSAGAEYFKSEIIEILVELLQPECIYERSDVEVRTLEGLPVREGLLFGQLPTEIVIEENVLKYGVDIATGQKTGFYIDQRINRQKVHDYSKGLDVLNCFSYTGGFTLNALAGGAKKVTSVDSSAAAMQQLMRNVQLNHLDGIRSEVIEGDVFKTLRLFRDQVRSFDLIVLDPPKFAPTVSQADKAARAYKDINLLGIKLLRPNGILVTFSCSGGISRDLFQKVVAGAALDAGSDLRIIEQLSQSPDHPVLISFPESFYLKGLICQK